MSEPYEDPRATEVLVRMEERLRNFTIKGYCISCYAEFHDISKEEAVDILNGCGALDGFYGQDIVIIDHMNKCKLISLLRDNVEVCGGTNPRAIFDDNATFSAGEFTLED